MREASKAEKKVFAPAERPEESVTAGPNRREQHQQLTVADSLGVPRCPCCQAPLVMRMSCMGPYFQCLCEDHMER